MINLLIPALIATTAWGQARAIRKDKELSAEQRKKLRKRNFKESDKIRDHCIISGLVGLVVTFFSGVGILAFASGANATSNVVLEFICGLLMVICLFVFLFMFVSTIIMFFLAGWEHSYSDRFKQTREFNKYRKEYGPEIHKRVEKVTLRLKKFEEDDKYKDKYDKAVKIAKDFTAETLELLEDCHVDTLKLVKKMCAEYNRKITLLMKS